MYTHSIPISKYTYTHGFTLGLCQCYTQGFIGIPLGCYEGIPLDMAQGVSLFVYTHVYTHYHKDYAQV